LEIITYIAIGALSSAVTHYLIKKRNNRVITEFKKSIDFIIKEHYDELAKKNNLIDYQKKVLYWISDGIHNIGSEEHQKNFDYNEKEFKKKIGRFFSITRVLTEGMKNEEYTENELVDILNFINDDFGNYCHYLSNNLNLDKYNDMIRKDR
jgi:hypothetical protein